MIQVLFVIIAIIAYIVIKENFFTKDDDAEGMKSPVQTPAQSSAEAPAILTNTKKITNVLRELNCDYEVHEESEGVNAITFMYQSSFFVFYVDDNKAMGTLVLPHIYSFPLSNVDKFSDVKNLINELNWKVLSTIYYTMSDDKHTCNVHICNSILLTMENGNREYLTEILQHIFFVRNSFIYRIGMDNDEDTPELD